MCASLLRYIPLFKDTLTLIYKWLFAFALKPENTTVSYEGVMSNFNSINFLRISWVHSFKTAITDFFGHLGGAKTSKDSILTL